MRAQDDVRLSWQVEPSSWDGYNVWYAETKERVPACRGCVGSIAVAACQPTGGARLVSCDDAGAVPGVAGDVRYYEVRGVCGGSEAPR